MWIESSIFPGVVSGAVTPATLWPGFECQAGLGLNLQGYLCFETGMSCEHTGSTTSDTRRLRQWKGFTRPGIPIHSMCVQVFGLPDDFGP